MPPTELYSEGWLLRLVLDWFEAHRAANDHPLSFRPRALWFSEALLASRFLAESRSDRLAESYTHADGVVGHFDMAPGARGEATVADGAEQLVVVEAKLGSPLSKGVKNAKNYGQAARNVACMAHMLDFKKRDPSSMDSLAFFVIAPESQIRSGIFEDFVTKPRIASQVEARVAQYGGARDEWLETAFRPTLEAIDVGLLSWEGIIEIVEQRDPDCELRSFYDQCLRFNPLRGTSNRP